MFPSRLVFFFMFLTVISEQRKMLYKDAGEVCRTEPDDWFCKPSRDCSTQKSARKKDISLDLCSLARDDRSPIYCCPSEKYISILDQSQNSRVKTNPEDPTRKSAESKAKDMCEAYTKYSFQILQMEPNLPATQSRNISQPICSIIPLVVGGVDAKPKEFPHMALIGSKEKRQTKMSWICGGSLISAKYVLSAAHCITNESLTLWVRLGELDISSETDDSEPVTLKIIKIIKHPEYKSPQVYNDIALFELESEVKFNSYVRPLCLQPTEDIESDELVASGWGHTKHDGVVSSKLKKVTLPYVNYEKCLKAYSDLANSEDYRKAIPKGFFEDLMLCAGGEKGKDICKGDSGGPLQIPHQSTCMYSIVGITSYSKGCAWGVPSIFTRVSHYLPWIVKHVWP